MSETANLADIAAKVSTELFGTFMWETRGPRDEDWPCETPEEHGKRRKKKTPKDGADPLEDTNPSGQPEAELADVATAPSSVTHPTDIVFYYDEPYSNHRTYINCDLKSYAAATIKKSEVKSDFEPHPGRVLS